MSTLENFIEPMYNVIAGIGASVIRLPVINSVGISNTKSFLVGLFIVFLVIFLVYYFMTGKKSGLRNASTIRYNIQRSDYEGSLIVADTAFSESKLDESLKGF